MHRMLLLVGLLTIMVTAVCGCVRHTYYVELTNGESFYVDPPLVLDTGSGLYSMSVNGVRRTVTMDDVAFLDDAVQICFKNAYTDDYTCFDALYQF